MNALTIRSPHQPPYILSTIRGQAQYFSNNRPFKRTNECPVIVLGYFN